MKYTYFIYPFVLPFTIIVMIVWKIKNRVLVQTLIEGESELLLLWRGSGVAGLDSAAFLHDAAVIVHRSEIEQYVLRLHPCSEDLCQLLALAVEHLRFEPLVHAVLCPLRICVKIQIPVIYPRHMHAVSVQFNHIKVIAAVRVALLILQHDKERIRRYDIGSAHRAAKVRNLEVFTLLYKACREVGGLLL